ncbi:MAG: hypothetical protein QM784_22000 [Polyangiaceae bacterium]
MNSQSTQPSLAKVFLWVPVLFMSLMIRAVLIAWLPGALDLVDDYRLALIMAPYLLVASFLLFAGSICLVRGRLTRCCSDSIGFPINLSNT